jgi:phosphoribosylformylglycinamidine synthase II
LAIPRELLEEIALSAAEYEKIVELLQREPNTLELGLFGALWSEHCGYKHSRALLRLLPSDSPHVLVEPGTENAGVVDAGNGLALVLKIESHNHPSAVEPFQGAATGVGGIVRDILAMGARPIALLNSLHFGPLEKERNRYLFHGIIGGISWYGNCIGIPDVAGEVSFAPSYSQNPLVNAMCVGVLPQNRLVRAHAPTPGCLLVLVGADTGKDGIHGASGLASRTFQGDREQRPAVQVGNPFLEKVLIEACLEVLELYPKSVIGMQDLGAAGLTSATVECAYRGGSGIWVDVAQVTRREANMTPYDVMLSESQERMLLILNPEGLDAVRTIFDKWDLTSAVIGQVTDDHNIRVYDGTERVGEVPVALLSEPPEYRTGGVKPDWLDKLQKKDLAEFAVPNISPAEVLLRLLASPTIASRQAIYRQYDHQVGINTVVPPGQADAAVIRLQGTPKGVALTVDGNGRVSYLDPYTGGALVVAEACRNLICVGAEPIALTDCLNFGNPERPEVYYQLEQSIQGIAAASRALGVPIVSGNVSLYNETDNTAIYPTPVIGALGLLEDVQYHCTAAFQKSEELVLLLGGATTAQTASMLAGSEMQELLNGCVAGQPVIDLELEARLQRLCQRAIANGLFSSAHDVSRGGLAVALAKSCLLGGIGFHGAFPFGDRWDATLFSETPSRIVVSITAEQMSLLDGMAVQDGIPYLVLGKTGGDRFVLSGLLDLTLKEMQICWEKGLEWATETGPR